MDAEYRTMEDAIRVYGKINQLVVAVEELSELQKEICKLLRGDGSVDHLAEEMADVEIMLAQIKMLAHCEIRTEEWRRMKLLRMRQRMNGRKQGTNNGDMKKNMDPASCMTQEALDEWCRTHRGHGDDADSDLQ